MGIGVTITQSLIAEVIGARNGEMFMVGMNKQSDWVSRIMSTRYAREGGTDYLSISILSIFQPKFSTTC